MQKALIDGAGYTHIYIQTDVYINMRMLHMYILDDKYVTNLDKYDAANHGKYDK